MESNSNAISPAVTAAIVLKDWERYGIAERVSYHFGLTEVLHRKERPNDKASADEAVPESGPPKNVCGVSSLLECVPSVPWHRLTKRQKRALKYETRTFNETAAKVHRDRKVFCHEPPRLPLRLNSATRVYFAYETTRIAFCLDASPSLTSTFGFSGSATDKNICPMDRLVHMARSFFTSLVQPISVPVATEDNRNWKPLLAVTVLAVYPRGSSRNQTSLLVRDFRVRDLESAELLAKKIGEWALGEVENEIAYRLDNRHGLGNEGNLGSFGAWTIPLYSSSLRDLLDAGDAALSTLSSTGRPCIVLATAGRSISCDGIIDIVSDRDRLDVPLVVLDLSSPTSHGQSGTSELPKRDEHFQLLNYDPIGSMFPLHLSDDTEALSSVCKATNGFFLDWKLLELSAKTKAGEVDQDSHLGADLFFAFRQHSIRPNAVQWYTLFSLSPLSPANQPSFGRLSPPLYLQQNVFHSGVAKTKPNRRPSALGSAGKAKPSPGPEASKHGEGGIQRVQTTFSTYIINPIPIKGLILMRVKEGYNKHGESSHTE